MLSTTKVYDISINNVMLVRSSCIKLITDKNKTTDKICYWLPWQHYDTLIWNEKELNSEIIMTIMVFKSKI